MIEFRKEALEEEFSQGKDGETIRLSKPSIYLLLLTLAVMAGAFLSWGIFGSVTDKAQMKGVMFPVEGTSEVSVPNPGVVRTLMVHKGDMVIPGQILAMIDVNRQYSTLTATEPGQVLTILQEQQSFDAFQPIVNLLTENTDKQVKTLVAFANFKTVRELDTDLEVQVNPSYLSREKNGYVPAQILSISKYPMSAHEAALKLKNEQFTQAVFPQEGAAFVVEIELEVNPDCPEEFNWTFEQEKHVDMSTGTLCDVQVITKRRSVFRYLFENLREKYRRTHEVVFE